MSLLKKLLMKGLKSIADDGHADGFVRPQVDERGNVTNPEAFDSEQSTDPMDFINPGALGRKAVMKAVPGAAKSVTSGLASKVMKATPDITSKEMEIARYTMNDLADRLGYAHPKAIQAMQKFNRIRDTINRK